LLEHCLFVQKKGIVKLTAKERKKIIEANKKMNCAALRTVGFAYKKTNNSAKKHTEKGFIFVGLVGIEDPPREEVCEAILVCQRAGIQVKMITGDHKETALAIAKEIKLQGSLIEGEQLENMTDEELSTIVQSTAIFARVKPEHKLRIVRALKLKGEIVAMTGDGVNDAPALKEAHIGIAMGKNGTDVSRSVADLVLKDDNFGTIVSAISEGRTIFSNIRKFVTYQLSCNLSELLILFIGVLVSPFLGWQIPILVALQLLFMNLVTDNLPAITLGFNQGSRDVMTEKPRKKTNILSKQLIALLIFTGCVLALFVLGVYYVAFNRLGVSSESARTIALVTLICLQIGSAFTFRSFRKGVLTRSPFVNPWLFFASVVSLLATGAVVYTPLLNIVFETVPLTLTGIFVAISAAVMFVILFDLLKCVNNKKRFFEL
ncbi:MAG: HAD-IC family P-type ATPase, partial [Candidatus Woesearchaeota archaeon]|nr:HAD-IC family P-type ATPase [Candidatus Woesearchaeota archaeon]